MDKQQYERMHQAAIYNSRMKEVVYRTSKEEIKKKVGNFIQQFWNYVKKFQAI